MGDCYYRAGEVMEEALQPRNRFGIEVVGRLIQ